MEGSTEPILDIVRGLSTITSVSIMLNQAKNFYSSVFRTRCFRCRGAGMLICRHCHGTKISRSYPLTRRIAGGYAKYEDPSVQHPCYHCGPYALNDFDYDREDDEEEAWNIMDNLNAAMANKLRPYKYRAVAGTVPCPTCYGQRVIYRHTPDFATLLNMRETWVEQAVRREPSRRLNPDLDTNAEYPIGRPPPKTPVVKTIPNIRGLEGRSIEEVVLPYVDDSDTTATSDDEDYGRRQPRKLKRPASQETKETKK